jgi:hypothetical protein
VSFIRLEQSHLPKFNILSQVSAMPLLEQNISANAHYCPSTTPKASVLDWDDEELPKEVRDLENLNVIV